MVRNFHRHIRAALVRWSVVILCVSAFLIVSCKVDVLGLFGSSDFDGRFAERDSFRFLTSAELHPSFAAPYSFVVITDTHIDGGDAHGLEKIGDVVAADASIKFIVVTGDITQGGYRQDLEKFITIAKSLPVPVYPVIGNHDIYFGNWSVWKDLIGSTTYRVESPDTTLLILDSANASFGKGQLDWLDSRLNSARKNTFIFTHDNLFTESMGDFQAVADIRERARMLSMLKGRGDAVFAGHVHRRIIREAGGVQYITIEDFRDHSIYCVVQVDVSGNISWEFKKL
ncbi:MAG: metallophosphoesterase [Treponema sp.]|nr:metallophosphoesterase [Treponema sp.]